MSGKEKEQEQEPQDLKPFEAALASLVPRADRLDQQRLIFLAGRQSALKDHPRPATRSGVGLWPAAFAAMTAAAGALLVMLLCRGEPSVVIRYIKVPAAQTDLANPAPSPNDRQRNVSLPPAEPAPQGPAAAPGMLASVASDWPPDSRAGQSRLQAPYPRPLDRILTQGLDPWRPPPAVEAVQAADPPQPYRQSLERLLEDQAQAEPPTPGPAARRLSTQEQTHET